MRSAYGHIAVMHGHPVEAAKSQGQSLPVVRLEDKDGPSHRLAWSRAQLLVISTVCSLLVLAIMGVVWRTKGSGLTQRFVHNRHQRMKFESTAALMTISATNSYTEENDDIPGSAYPFTANYMLVEPYVDTLLTVEDADAGLTYTWSFEDGGSASGRAVTHCFETVGVTSFTLKVVKSEMDGEEALVSNTQHQVLSRYVRREVRSLSETDLSNYLAAANEVYTLKPSGGRRKYGSAFTSIQEIAAIYNQLASDVECNHLADGMGFMTSHAGLLLTFERSIQAVNPSLAVPYWDFTIDSEAAKASGNVSSFYESAVFADDMFGQPSDWTAGDVEDMSLSDGVFAGLKVRRNMWDYGLAHCPYGYSRSPLNVNPSSTVTRHSRAYGVTIQPPDCADHYAVIQATSLRALHAKLQTRALDPLLTVVGGVANADMTFLQTQLDYSYVPSFARSASKAQWALYRRGLLSNHEYCLSPSTSTSQQGGLICRPTCFDLDFDTLTTEDASTILKEVHPLFAGSDGDQYRYNARGEDVGVVLLQALCNGFEGLQPMFGDLTDVPVNDPVYWSSLATIERLWQWKRINGIEDMSWPADGSSCYGHGESDIVTGVFKLDSSSNSTEYLSNVQLLELTDPTVLNDDMTYLYDSFEWSHCAGVTTFGGLGLGTITTADQEV